MSKTIAFSNHKGGVAKTTSCFSIGACLAERGYKVLLLDLDPQVNLTITAGINPDNLETSLVDILQPDNDRFDPASIIHKTTLPGLDILPADQRLIGFEMNASNSTSYEKSLVTPVNHFRNHYDYILMDCPPSMGSLAIIALTAAELAMIPVLCDYYSTRGLINLIEIINAVRNHTNPHLLYRIFVTMYDPRPLISRMIYDQLQTNFPNSMFDTAISMDIRLRESAAANEPIIIYARKAKSSQQYQQLSSEIIQYFEITQNSKQIVPGTNQ